jgi:hypothetical protein
MRWLFCDQCIVATELEIAALHFADYSPRLFVPRRGMNFI